MMATRSSRSLFHPCPPRSTVSLFLLLLCSLLLLSRSSATTDSSDSNKPPSNHQYQQHHAHSQSQHNAETHHASTAQEAAAPAHDDVRLPHVVHHGQEHQQGHSAGLGEAGGQAQPGGERQQQAEHQKARDDFLESQRSQLDRFQQDMFGGSSSALSLGGSPFGSLMQGLFSGLSSASFVRPHVEFGKTDDGRYLIAKVNLPDSKAKGKHSSALQGAKRNIAYSLTSSETLQVRVETESDGTKMSSSEEFSLPHPVAREDLSVIPASDGSIHIKMRLLSDTEARKVAASERRDEQRAGDAVVRGLFGDGDAMPPSLRMPSIDEVLDTLLGNSGARVGQGADGADGDGDAMGMFRPVAPLIIRFRPPGTGPGTRRGGRASSNAEQKSSSNDAKQALFEELPSAAHSERCHKSHGADRVELRKCLCDVTPVATRAVCYSRLVARSINTARGVPALGEFGARTKKAAYDCVSSASEDQVQCMERVAASVVHFVKNNDSGDGEREAVRKALEEEDQTASHFSKTSSGGLNVLQIVACAIVLSVAFWSAVAYAARRGYFGTRSGGLLSQLSSAMTQQKAALSKSLKSNGLGKGLGMGMGGSAGSLPMTGSTDHKPGSWGKDEGNKMK